MATKPIYVPLIGQRVILAVDPETAVAPARIVIYTEAGDPPPKDLIIDSDARIELLDALEGGHGIKAP